MKVTYTKQYRGLMALFRDCGLVKRDTRLRIASDVLGRKVETFTSLTLRDVEEITLHLKSWKHIQENRLYEGVVYTDALAYTKLLCDDSELLLSSDDLFPTEASRRVFKDVIMAKTNFETPSMSEVDDILGDVARGNDDLDIVELSDTLGRLPSSKVVPAPVVSLGLSLGVGGLPRGSVVHVWGEKHGGKTLLANHFIAEAQQAGIPAVLIDAEAAADGPFMAVAGVDVDNVRIVRPHDLENASELLRKLARSGALVVFDSIAAAESSRELKRNLSKESPRVGGNAMLWKSTLSIFRVLAKKYGTTLVMINQVRANMNAGPMQNPDKAYGTQAIQHSADVSIRVSAVREKRDSLRNNGYKVSRMRFDKNRNSGQLDVVDVTFKPGRPYDRSIDIVRSCGNPIEPGNEMTYGELSFYALVANHIYDDASQSFVPRNNRFAIAIDPLMMAAIRKDDPKFEEVDIEPAEDYTGLWDEDNPAPDVDIDNYAGFTLPYVGEVNAMKWLKRHPHARDLIAERLLNGLNRRDDFLMEFD